jgi:hypothetical protein
MQVSYILCQPKAYVCYKYYANQTNTLKIKGKLNLIVHNKESNYCH